ncbi:MAG: hypothetical protein H6659_18085 [Ardenticatenaceae bacterium]|nr:hypothetical protein [Ardenticatenaceae bacterium]
MKIIGVVGETAVCRRLTTTLQDQYGIRTIDVTDTAREYAAEEARPDPPQQISAPTGSHAPAKRLAQHGPEYFVEQVVRVIEEDHGDWPVICLTTPMSGAMVQALRAQFGSDLIVVAVQQKEEETAVSPSTNAPTPTPPRAAELADVHFTLIGGAANLKAQIERLLIPRLPHKEMNKP